ncbi:MAG: vWA domain-containing protein [Acidimicrobiales bacterium]
MTSDYALPEDGDPIGVEERYAVFPFYLCLDVSASMAGEPIEAVNRQLPLLRVAVGEDPAVAEVIRFGVVTFSDVAHTVLPLCDLSLVEEVPVLAAQGRTSYAAAFDHLARLIESDYHASRVGGDRWYRPAVVFISDGHPTDDDEHWRSAHRRLTAPSWKRHPNILAFGFGDADPTVLALVSEGKPNRAFIAAEGADPARVVPELMAGLITSIVSSSASVYEGSTQLVPPDIPTMTPIPVDQLD